MSRAEGKLPLYFGPSYRKLESSESAQSDLTAEWGFDRPGFQEPDTEAGVLAPTLRSEIGVVLRPLDHNTGLRGYRADTVNYLDVAFPATEVLDFTKLHLSDAVIVQPK